MNARHVDLENLDGFGEADLHKLVERTVIDLKENDRRRRENFKRSLLIKIVPSNSFKELVEEGAGIGEISR